MCLPYSVPAMGPYSTGFPVARQPGLHSPPNDVSCLRRPTLPGSTLLPQVRRCRRHRRSHRVAGRFSMGDCGSCARRTGDCTRIASHRKSTWSREHGAVCVQLRAPDISQMSPDERANRLFNRVMILAEAGRNDSVRFFLPMALGAYSQLPTLDADARYHMGLLQLAGGDPSAALAQADTIQRAI